MTRTKTEGKPKSDDVSDEDVVDVDFEDLD